MGYWDKTAKKWGKEISKINPSHWGGNKDSRVHFDRGYHEGKLEEIMDKAPERESYYSEIGGDYNDKLNKNMGDVKYDIKPDYSRSDNILSRLESMATSDQLSEFNKKALDKSRSQYAEKKENLDSAYANQSQSLLDRLAITGGYNASSRENALRNAQKDKMFAKQGLSKQQSDAEQNIHLADAAQKQTLLDRLAGIRMAQDESANRQENANRNTILNAISSGLGIEQSNRTMKAQDIRDKNAWEREKWKIRARGQANIETADSI